MSMSADETARGTSPQRHWNDKQRGDWHRENGPFHACDCDSCGYWREREREEENEQ